MNRTIRHGYIFWDFSIALFLLLTLVASLAIITGQHQRAERQFKANAQAHLALENRALELLTGTAAQPATQPSATMRRLEARAPAGTCWVELSGPPATLVTLIPITALPGGPR